MSAKERAEGTGKFVEKKLTLDKILFSAKYLHKMLYHQTTTNQTKINEFKIILCCKCELMRPSKGIINLAILRTIFGYLFVRKLNLLQMQKIQCNCLHAEQPCKNFTHLICTAVFSATFDMSSQHKCQQLFQIL